VATQIGTELRCKPERGEVRSERVTDKDRKSTLPPEIKVDLSARIDSGAHSCDVTAKNTCKPGIAVNLPEPNTAS
jgi:hypothetical protein